MKNILLIGGAGFVGSVTCEELIKKNYNVIVLDNLYQGFKQAIHPHARFIEGTIEDEVLLDTIFKKYEIYAVMDFAGETLIEFSMTDPFRYFKANIIDGLNILNCMVKHGVKRFIFSSSSAVYGEAEEIPMTEIHRKLPANSYGESKLIFEQILRWYYLIHGIQSISFRYFNAAGASENYGEAHNPETHLIPLILQVALGKRDKILVFGDDYSTKDGTCIRDYTHVCDLAQAHILGFENIDKFGYDAFNLGNGDGYTVMEVIQAAREVTGQQITTEIVNRRAGDAAVMVASSNKAKEKLCWQPQFPKIKQIVETAYNWHKKNPNGYIK
jgi:UDP-glucose 4-epimerase